MFYLDDIALIIEGTFPSQSGEEVTIHPEDVLELAETYDPVNSHDAFIVPGHSSDPQFGVPDTDTAVSLGWIKKVYAKFNEKKQKLELRGKLEIHPVLMNWLEQKLYKYKSLAFYPRGDARNPTPGKLYIRHLAVLGSQPPAIKGLGTLLSFAENDFKMTIALLQETEENELSDMKSKKLAEDTRNINSDGDEPVLQEEDMEEMEALAEGKGTPGRKDNISSIPETGESVDDPEDLEPKGLKEKKGLHTGESIKGKKAVKKKPLGLSESEIEGTINAFAEDDEDEIEVPEVPEGDVSEEERNAFAKENIPIMLEQVLSSGPRGYKGEITRFDPEPMPENNFLFDVNAGKFMGKFIDDSEDLEEVYEFEMKKEGDGWTFEYTLADTGLDEFAEDGDEPTGEELAAQLDPDEQEEDDSLEGLSEGRTIAAPQTSLPEAQVFNELPPVARPSKMDEMQEEIAMMRMQLLELREMMIGGLAERAYGEGKFLQSTLAEKDFRAFAEALYDMSKASKPALCAFSEAEGKKKASVFDVFKTIVERLPAQVMPGVALSEGVGEGEKEPILPLMPAGYSQDPSGVKLLSEIVQFCEDNSLDINRSSDFSQAHKEVIKKKESN